jgi:ketosteroid isomerase-like protein
MTHPNAALIDRFYQAFGRRDAAAMAACYHAEVEFSDPVFPSLRGAEAGRMWAMLCARGKDLTIEHSGVLADDTTGVAHWDARYSFSATGRKVLNRIDASFRFRDGLIVHHVDRFSFYRWSRQALGPLGLVLGWTPLVRNKVRAQAAKGLAEFRG